MSFNFVKAHGLKIAQDGYIENLVAESLANDPSLEIGRVWYNTTTKEFKFVTDIEGTPTAVTFASKEELIEYINLLASPQGSAEVGYDGHTADTGSFVVPSGNVQETLDTIINKISSVETSASKGVTVLDEGGNVLDISENLNFVGADIMAVQSGPNEVTIYSPPPDFADSYHTGDNTISSINTTTRSVSNPADGSFNIGSWTPGQSVSSTRDNSLNYNSPGAVGFADETTSFTAIVYGADDTTPLAQVQLTNINGNTSQSNGGITVSISNWAPDSFRFRANINVAIDLNTIIPNGGRFSVSLTHTNSYLGSFSKTQGPMFYDTDGLTATISSVDIVENTPNIKHLSGVVYYDQGSTFDISVADIDNINYLTWPSNDRVLYVSSYTEFGISNHYIQTNGLTNWTTDHNVNNASISETQSITRDNFRYIGSSANISSYPIDWTNGNTVNSPNKTILIDTWDIDSTLTDEEFVDEDKRLQSDLSTPWDSTQALGVSDLMVVNDVLRRQYGNWTSYLPTNTVDYSATNTNDQYYYRKFTNTSGGTKQSGIFYIQGISEAELGSDVFIWISKDGSAWLDCTQDMIVATPGDGDGCRVESVSYSLPYLKFSFGFDSVANNGEIYVRVMMPNGSTSQMGTLRITDW